jgi:glutamine synthetase
VWKGKERFAGDGYAGLSEFAIFIGGVIKHAKALNAITNPGTNSTQAAGRGSRRNLAIPRATARRRFAFYVSIRRAAHQCAFRSDRESVPRVLGDADGRARRRAGQDPPGDPMDKNLASSQEAAGFRIRARRSTGARPSRPSRSSPRAAFTDDMIGPIGLKMEVTRFRMTTHPVEYDVLQPLKPQRARCRGSGAGAGRLLVSDDFNTLRHDDSPS